jgi:pimeloyl-ACP methyl ester carboxylesterase
MSRYTRYPHPAWGAAGLLACALSLLGCASGTAAPPGDEATSASAVPAAAPAAPARVEVVAHPVPDDLPVFLLRAHAADAGAVIFMAGMCGHSQGYVQSFQWSASERAHVLGLQGDEACSDDGVWRKWSRDLDALDRRIDRALAAAGLAPAPGSVALIGYSQGGTRAIELAARFPEKYQRLAVIGAPKEATVRELRKARRVAVMAGEKDAPKWRRSQAAALERGGLSARYFELPGAEHAAMGPEAERVMGEVLDFLLERSGT